MKRHIGVSTICLIVLSSLLTEAQTAKTSPGAGPVIMVATTNGTFEFETYPNEAPKTVGHIITLVEQGFYNGLRVHRVVEGGLVQFGDPQTRDLRNRDKWGAGPAAGSGRSIGVAEINSKRSHKRGTVGMAHLGNPAEADSQIYILIKPRPDLNSNYTVVGQVISGMNVVERIEELDIIQQVTVRP
mgnify:FL=1|tara:strand:+ start:962 stop:1519 length:558 start_codon:yes stop_codon:yes gene_type:complete